jgi:hypothetical protein
MKFFSGRSLVFNCLYASRPSIVYVVDIELQAGR